MSTDTTIPDEIIDQLVTLHRTIVSGQRVNTENGPGVKIALTYHQASVIDRAACLIEKMQEAIHDAVMAERAWRPIGTAPKTGETIIVRLANGEVFSATWHVYGSNPGWHVSSDIGFVSPHHWMPYPTAPKAEG